MRRTLVAALLVVCPAHAWTVVGPCPITEGGSCVTSPNYPTNYPVEIDCTITPTPGVAIFVAAPWAVEPDSSCDYDYLTIEGTRYCNTGNPLATGQSTIVPTQDILFHSDDGTTAAGFKLCQHSPPSAPSPPISPPASPPAIPPPSPPGTICSDDCATARNGVCEDPYGNPNQDFTQTSTKLGDCAAGTDCFDCNPTMLCSSCTAECRNRGLRMGQAHYCLEAAFNDGRCDPACNVRECGNDGYRAPDGTGESDCSALEVATSCTLDVTAADTTKPANSTGAPYVIGSRDRATRVAMELLLTKMAPVSLNFDSSTGLWSLGVDFTTRLRWRDSRFKTNPCANYLTELIDLEAADAGAVTRIRKEAYKELMWFPKVQLSGKTIDYSIDSVDKSRSVYEAGLTYQEAGLGGAWDKSMASSPQVPMMSPDGQTTCYDCLTHTMKVNTVLDLVPQPEFHYYPFDTQRFVFTFAIGEANIFSCSEIFSSLNMSTSNMDAILPTSGEWAGVGLSASHVDGDVRTCQVTMTVRRNSAIFVVKQVLPSTIVMYAGMSALFMSAADHTGDRAATILVAALILMVNFQTDIGLGKITYLVWWDVFNLVSILQLAVILVTSLWEHLLIYSGDLCKATDINRVQRVAFLLFFYPVMFVWLLLLGINESYGDPSAWSILAAGTLLVGIFSVLAYRRLHNRGNQMRTEAIAKLGDTNPSQPIFSSVLKEAFVAFDVDSSGLLDMDEVRTLLKACLPSAEPSEFAETILGVRAFANTDGELTFNAFHDALLKVLPDVTGEKLTKDGKLTGIHFDMGQTQHESNSGVEALPRSASQRESNSGVEALPLSA